MLFFCLLKQVFLLKAVYPPLSQQLYFLQWLIAEFLLMTVQVVEKLVTKLKCRNYLQHPVDI